MTEQEHDNLFRILSAGIQYLDIHSQCGDRIVDPRELLGKTIIAMLEELDFIYDNEKANDEKVSS